ncbi:hypothetical protein CJ030_MR8G016817 [Morella rubra]|uniref:RNase H type-1 domain-containing protein n=1 Tax=Morella rubra TaxID=262757 RepID=A0A6A1UTQ7_9ROSI|nr:hypothetical protein CJ030_MR8G016817 [Morella rubra]
MDPSLLPELPIEDHQRFQLFALIAWDMTWWTRNQIVHNVVPLDVLQLSSRIHKVCDEHMAAWQHKRDLALPNRWRPPDVDHFKVNFDVAVREDFAVGAAVIKNHLGQIVGACVEKIFIEDPEEGEIRAAHLGLLEAERCGSRKIVVEGDSRQAIEAFRCYPEKRNWRCHGRIGDIVGFASAFDSCSFSFVYRGANEEAHLLARWAASKIMSGDYPAVHEHFSKLDWVYAGTDPPYFFSCCSFLIKAFSYDQKIIIITSSSYRKTNLNNSGYT